MTDNKTHAAPKDQVIALDIVQFQDDGRFGICVDDDLRFYATPSRLVAIAMMHGLEKKFRAVYELGFARGKQAGGQA